MREYQHTNTSKNHADDVVVDLVESVVSGAEVVGALAVDAVEVGGEACAMA